MWKCKISRATLIKKGALHEVLLRLKIKQYKRLKNIKVMRIDHSYTPDALIIDWANRKVTALEVETSRNTNYYLKNPNGCNKKKESRPDVDNVILVMVDRSRRTVKEFNTVLKLRKAELTLPEITEKTGIAIDTIRDWLYRDRKPPHLRKMKKLQAVGVTLEVIPLSIIGE